MGFISDIFGGGGSSSPSVGFQTIPQTPEAIEARKRLYELATGQPPDVPRRGIAPLPAMTEERETARATAMELIQPQDIFSLPEVQGIIQEAITMGDLLTNRLGRALQSAGALTATSGRDILGRAVTDVQKNLASSLAPFAMEERARRTGLIPVLEGLGLTEELRKMGFTQAELDALFQQELTESQQLQTFTIPLLQSVIGLQPGVQPYLTGGGAGQTGLESLSGIIGPILSSVLSSGGGGGQTGGGGGDDWMKYAALGAMFLCDVRAKENFARIDNALEKVNRLEGHTYNFINEDNRSAGIIAQELEKVLPESVIEHHGIKFIKIDGVVALIINAIKELDQKASEALFEAKWAF